MKTMRKMILTIALLTLVIDPVPGADEGARREAGWIPLFNGRDLEGWLPKIKGHEPGANFGDTFRIEHGVLKVGYDKYPRFDGRFGHLFFSKPFSHYRLRLEYRFVGEQAPGGPAWAWRNSGVMIHGQTPQSMRRDQDFPVSIEVQLLGGRAQGKRTTANVCSPGTHFVHKGKLVTRHCNDSSSDTYPGDQWVAVEIEVRGNGKIRHFVNGQLVFEYEQPQLDENDPDARRLIAAGADKMLRAGTISLQSESHPVEFRKIEIMPLDE